MRYYESLYIVNPNYEQERLDDVMKSVADKSIECGFSIINHRIWGKKRLAYSIEKNKYGSYILFHFETESTKNLDDFERFMVLQKTILRNQTISLANKPEAHVEDEPAKNEEQKETTEGSSVATKTKEKLNIEPDKNEEQKETAEGSSVATKTKEKSNVESEQNSEKEPLIEEEKAVEIEETLAQNEEIEEKVELAIEEETTEEVQE